MAVWCISGSKPEIHWRPKTARIAVKIYLQISTCFFANISSRRTATIRDSDQNRLMIVEGVLGVKAAGAGSPEGAVNPFSAMVATKMSVKFASSSFVLSIGSGERDSTMGV